MRVLFALLCTVAVVSAGIACGDSECGPDSLIGTGKCCSAYGFCGSTSAYCGSGCTNGACTGRTLSGCQLTGQACPSGKCCSQYGYCGTTAAYCSRDPEFNCYSNCWSAAPKTSSSTKSTTSSTTSTTSTTSSTSSTSSTKASTVPSTSSAASTLVGCQLTGCGSSTEGKCCSQYGYCGNTAAHCSTSESCYSGCWSSVPAASRVYVGYWGDWTVQGNCPVTPESIPANNYTHINYAFASFNPSTGDLNSLDATLVNRLLALKTRNPSLKVLVSLGGGAAGDAPWTQLTSSATASARFYSTVLGWLNTYGFDGLDVDWEFPQEGEQSKVVAFFRQTRAALGTGKLLTTAGAAAWNVPQYVPGQWHQYVDFINVMNYDYFGSWSTTTGPISPINGATDSIEITMNAYINDGVPANKLVFGFANYGYTWAVASGTPQIGSAVIPDAGFAGACANSAGYIGATDIANLRRNPPAGFVERWDAAAQMPYATWGQQFATYENITSIKIKTDIVKQRGYLGGMLWVMDPNKEIDSYIWAQLKQ